MQSESTQEFRLRIKHSGTAYRKAWLSLPRRDRSLGKALGYQTWQTCLQYWISNQQSVKARLLRKAWNSTKKTLAKLENRGAHLDQARFYDQLSWIALVGYDFLWTSKARHQMLREGVEYGRRAAKAILEMESSQKDLLSRICAQIALLIDALEEDGTDPSEEEQLEKEGQEYWNRALQLSRVSAVFQTALSPNGFSHLVGDAESDKLAQEALALAEQRKDNLALGFVLDQLSTKAFFKAFPVPDRSENVRLAIDALKLAERAAEMHGLTNSASPNNGVIWPDSPYSEHFVQLSWFQTDLTKKRLYLEKSLSETRSLLKKARFSGQPKVLAYSHHVTGTVLSELSQTEHHFSRKTKLLQRAIRHRIICCKITERIQPKAIGYVGAYIGALGTETSWLAEIAKSSQSRIRLLRAAIRHDEKGVRLYSEYTDRVSKGESHPVRPMLAHRYGGYGDRLVRLYKETGNDEVLRKAAKAYEDLILNLKGTPLFIGIAEAYWKAARTYDSLQAHQAASSYFQEASEAYRILAEKTPQLSTLYQECSQYLEAWNYIENAKAANARLSFDEAEKYYRKAAALHEPSRKWRLLATYYTGLAELESAESLSRNGRSSEAAHTFLNAAQVFNDSQIQLQSQLGLLDQPEEKAMIENLLNKSRELYCQARIAIEEARIAESQGDYNSSSEKFGIAADRLERIWRTSRSARERAEISYISLLSRAWQQMARAIGGDHQGFSPAIRKFGEAAQYAQSEDSRTLATAYDSFCRALNSNNRFNNSFRLVDYEAAQKWFSKSAVQFAKAGFENASAHAQASKLLLMAHQETITRTVKNPDQTTDFINAKAESILVEASATFEKAGQPAKKLRVQRLLEYLKFQTKQPPEPGIWDLASDISVSLAFSPPIEPRTLPVGNSRFTGPDIEARYLEPTADIDQSVDHLLEIQIVNAGTRPIRLIRLEDAAPHGTQVLESPENFTLERGSLLLKDTRMDPLGTETLRILLRPNRKDLVIANSRIVFADEKGRQTQRALPPRVISVPPILRFLVDEFLQDYNLKRLSPAASGWRTLVSITESIGIPRSHVYGEPRYGRRYGAQLEVLIKSGLVESRTFPGERGRGGNVTKVRVVFENPKIRSISETLPRLQTRNNESASESIAQQNGQTNY